MINRVFYRGETAVLVRGGKPVAKIVPVRRPGKTGKELAAVWPKLPHLSPAEAELLERDLAAARQALPTLISKWD